MSVSNLYTYSLKSGSGNIQSKVQVKSTGFEFDRYFAVVDMHQKIITAREVPKLLLITVKITTHFICFSYGDSEINFPIKTLKNNITVSLFSEKVKAYTTSSLIDNWFSEVLGFSSQLVSFWDFTQTEFLGNSFVDEGHIYLVNQIAINDLSERVGKEIPIACLRPNIIVSGFSAYEEDRWKKIKIGDQLFEVTSKCPKCVMTSIASDGLITKGELLKVLASYKKEGNQVVFGIYLKPLTSGQIRVNDPVEILEYNG